MKKFLEKAVTHVERIFPSIYEARVKRGSYHFALAFSRNTLLAVGVNQPDKVDAKAYRIARRLNLQEKMEYPYCHAEESLIGRLIGIAKLDASLNVVVLRMNKYLNLCESAPCSSCCEVLRAYGLRKVWHSKPVRPIDYGKITEILEFLRNNRMEKYSILISPDNKCSLIYTDKKCKFESFEGLLLYLRRTFRE